MKIVLLVAGALILVGAAILGSRRWSRGVRWALWTGMALGAVMVLLLWGYVCVAFRPERDTLPGLHVEALRRYREWAAEMTELFEELETVGESITKTRHPKIFIGKINAHPAGEIEGVIAELRHLAAQGHEDEIRSYLDSVLPEAQLNG